MDNDTRIDLTGSSRPFSATRESTLELSLAPIDLNLVEPSLLTATEKGWLNIYHARVRDTLSHLLDEETRAWLDHATRAICSFLSCPRKRASTFTQRDETDQRHVTEENSPVTGAHPQNQRARLQALPAPQACLF